MKGNCLVGKLDINKVTEAINRCKNIVYSKGKMTNCNVNISIQLTSDRFISLHLLYLGVRASNTLTLNFSGWGSSSGPDWRWGC